ncbi:MAG: hypothetical protein HY235_25285 [Acidobacteria bacterium]|nr:hypothetical protein [Acidobacteriota bacterium]
MLDLTGLTDAEIERLGRRRFNELYINLRDCGVLGAHDASDVVIWRERFDHAFFTTTDPISHRDRKDLLAVDRIQRVAWIGPVIQGLVDNTQCWEVPSPTGRVRPPNRLYIASPQFYVVWLEPRISGGWRFSSAYPAAAQTISGYVRRGTMIWRS